MKTNVKESQSILVPYSDSDESETNLNATTSRNLIDKSKKFDFNTEIFIQFILKLC